MHTYAVLAILAGASISPAPPGTGVGAGAWPVCLSSPAQPGHSYELDTGGQYGALSPPGQRGIDVINTGSGPERIQMGVRSLFPGQHLPGAITIPPAWITFGTNPVPAGPGRDAWSTVVVHVPPGARSGAYAAALTASVITSAARQPGADAALGAQAATDVVFTVGISRPPASWPQDVTAPCWTPPASGPPLPLWSGTPRPAGTGQPAYLPAASAPPSQARGYGLAWLAAAAVITAALAGRRRHHGGHRA